MKKHYILLQSISWVVFLILGLQSYQSTAQSQPVLTF